MVVRGFFVGLLMVSAGVGPVRAAPVNCDAIEAALSAAEDTAEFALAGDAAKVKAGATDIGMALKAIRVSLSPAAYQAAAEGLARIDGADHAGAALAALDVYKATVSELGDMMPSGKHVAMLDYAGFRLKALLMPKSPDWTALDAEVAAAGAHWQAAKLTLKDQATADLLDEIHAGLSKAMKARDAAWLGNVAALELAAVDLLERQVKNTDKGACK